MQGNSTTLLTFGVRFSRVVFLAVLGLSIVFPSLAAARTIRVAVLLDQPSSHLELVAHKIVDEIRTLNEPEHSIEFVAKNLRAANGTQPNIEATLKELLKDDDVELVLALGAVSSMVATQLGSLPKPVFAPFVWDPSAQSLPGDGTGSGVQNLSYLSLPYSFGRAYKTLHEITNATKVGLVVDGAMTDASPDFETALKKEVAALGGTILLIRGDSEKALEALGQVDAVIVTPLNLFDASFQEKLLHELMTRRLPSFGFLSLESVELGVLMTEFPAEYIQKLGRRLAINTQRFLAGEDPGKFVTNFEGGPMRIAINVSTARTIGFDFPWTVEIDAIPVSGNAPTSPALTLDQVLQQALVQNLGIKSNELDVLAESKAIGEVRAQLLPSIDLFASLATIDADRSRAANGAQPQLVGSGTLRAEQIIYSDDAWAEYSIQESAVENSQAILEATALDVTQDAAIAYFNVLRGQSLTHVNRANLDLARKNLELARVRFSVGSATEADVFRWRSQIAASKQALVQAHLDTRKAKIELGRILGRGDADAIHIAFEEDNQKELNRFGDLMEIMTNKRFTDILGEFLTLEALSNSPEVAQISAGLDIQRRQKTRAERAFWVPTVFARADLTATPLRAGDSSDFPVIPGLETPNDFGYEISIRLSLPLLTSGERFYTSERVDLEIQSLEIQRRDLELVLKQRVQNAIYDSAASMISIELAEIQFETATQNLELVSNAYAAGQVGIVDLLDAQNNAFTARQGLVNATYDFMVSIANLERSVGASRFFASDTSREDFKKRMSDYFSQRGVKK